MYRKILLQSVALALCLVCLNVLAARDFVPGLAEAVRLDSGRKGEKDNSAPCIEMQKCPACINAAGMKESNSQMRKHEKNGHDYLAGDTCMEVATRDAGLQRYIDAHRQSSAGL